MYIYSFTFNLTWSFNSDFFLISIITFKLLVVKVLIGILFSSILLLLLELIELSLTVKFICWWLLVLVNFGVVDVYLKI